MGDIVVDGEKYKVIENLGYQGGHFAKVVKTPGGERTAVKPYKNSAWRWWTPEDRLGR